MMATRKNIERARRGAAWLDKKLGRGWRRKIRRRNLDMSMGYMGDTSECGCIVAQLDLARSDDGVGSYIRGLDELGIPWQKAPQLGFDLGTDGEAWDELTEAWREVLREGS